MSDLDKALRARLGQPSWNLSHETSLAARVLLDLLGLHAPEPIDRDEPDGRAVCGHCLASDGDLAGYPCRTVQTISRRFRMSPGVSGEDRSEPTPAPREYDRDEPDGVAKVRDRLGRIWNRNDRNGFWYEHGCAPQTWPELWSQLRPLSEVVTPEGPA